jgi:hypothetical protein
VGGGAHLEEVAMSTKTDLTTFDSMLKGLFPRTPEEMPEWARKAWAERAELEKTGARVAVTGHDDNCGSNCRNVGPATLVHDLCGHHGERLERIASGALPRVLAASDWRHYADGHYAPIWYAWCAMWGEIAWLRARGFMADKVMYETEYPS